ncbi:MAG: hypothetical protein RBU25_04865 [Lentisphaeria bacterium]|jgi:hypothetical protein|nr:hypothetical protein [Lentisphaeria bacterium]
MLELTNLRHGAVVNAGDGVEGGNDIVIQVEGLADPGSLVEVNGARARLVGRRFQAPATLARQFNDIVVTSRSKHGEAQLKIRVVWDRKSFRRYNFFIDDNIFFLTDICQQGCRSLFDHFYLAFLRRMHREYGTKFTVNLFHHNDHHEFSLSDFPDRYQGEWRENADWLKLSFHAHSEFPDRPYGQPDGSKLAADYDRMQAEVARFAGEEVFYPPVVIHWAMVHPRALPVLVKRGVKVLTGGFIGDPAPEHEPDIQYRTADIGYFQDTETALYLEQKRVLYDFAQGLAFSKGNFCANKVPLPAVLPRLEAACHSPVYRDTLSLATHEQYFFPYYHNYIPDHGERIETALRYITEQGYQPIYFNDGFLGNPAWS